MDCCCLVMGGFVLCNTSGSKIVWNIVSILVSHVILCQIANGCLFGYFPSKIGLAICSLCIRLDISVLERAGLIITNVQLFKENKDERKITKLLSSSNTGSTKPITKTFHFLLQSFNGMTLRFTFFL